MLVSKLHRCHQICKRAFSTLPSLHTSHRKRGSLYSRISPLGDPKVSISPVLNRWLQQQVVQGRVIDQSEFRYIITKLRSFKRFSHALELSEWMGKCNQFQVTSGDVAVRLNLISHVHGIQQAEEFFTNIPDKLKDFKAYGALLSCYAHDKSVEKAEATMQKMKKLGFTTGLRLSHNVMMGLYFHTGNREKLDNLAREMEEKGINYDKITYCILLNAHATSSNLVAMENLLMKMEADPYIVMDWNVYAVVTNGYILARKMDKALVTARKVEQLCRSRNGRTSFEMLLTLYARIGQKKEVYRVWDMLKEIKLIYNTTYLAMFSSLSILDDIDGIGKIFEDWEANRKHFDIRILNFVVATYCGEGLLEKAKLLLESCNQPEAGTWDRLAAGYHRFRHMDKAVDALKKALRISTPGYRPNDATLLGCIDYLDGKDVDEAAAFKRLLGEYGYPINDIRDTVEKQSSSGVLDLRSSKLNNMVTRCR